MTALLRWLWPCFGLPHRWVEGQKHYCDDFGTWFHEGRRCLRCGRFEGAAVDVRRRRV